MTRLRHAAALLAVSALLGVAACGESDSAAPANSGKSEGKATSTPDDKRSGGYGY